MMMDAMEIYISENASEKKTGEMLAENANDILEKAEELSKELGHKVTVEELSEETGISEEKIRDAARITADHIEFLESEGWRMDMPQNQDFKYVLQDFGNIYIGAVIPMRKC